VWRLGRQVSYVKLSRPSQNWGPRDSQCIGQLIGGERLYPGACVPHASVEFSIIQAGSYSISLWCRYGTASGEPVSMTDQQPALESAGLYGQVESGRPSLPSSLEKVCGGYPSTAAGPIRSPWATE